MDKAKDMVFAHVVDSRFLEKSVRICISLDITKALKNYSSESKLKSVEMVLEACESMDARKIRLRT